MKFFHEIMLRHNECIVQLSDKNLLHSYHVLQGIVTILRAHVAEAPSPTSSLLPSSASWTLHPKQEPISQDVEAEGIYDRPLMLFWNEESSSDDEPSMSLFSAAVLFNLALVCHWMGNIYGSERSLTLASKLYQVVNELLGGTAYTSCRPALVLLSLALHNAGLLQNFFGNYPGYHRCMEALMSLIPHMLMKDDPVEHHLLCSLRMWQCTGPPVAAAA